MLIKNFINNLTNNYHVIGKYSFLLGVLLLPTALPLAGIFLLFSIFISFFKIKFSFLKDKINLSIFITIGLILFTTINHFINPISKELKDFNSSLIWLNLFNWIPTLIFFIGFQHYLKTKENRLIFSKYLFAGTVPVIASCLFQIFFDLDGPFEIFNGLIVWFQKPIEITGGVSGLFSNRNYAGFWLAVNLPFSFYFLRKNLKCKTRILPSLLITLLIIYLIISTNSRNAFLGMISTFFVYFGSKSILIFSIFIALFIFIFIFTPIININIIEFFPEVVTRFSVTNFFINSPRIVLFRSAFNFILQRPFLGWGSGTFALIYAIKENMWNPPFVFYEPQHTHNLFLEIAFNFGLPISILVTSIAFIIFTKSLLLTLSYKLKDDFYNLDKAWICAGLVVLIMHVNDMPFYDGKVSLLVSILFAGLKCIAFAKKDLEIQPDKFS